MYLNEQGRETVLEEEGNGDGKRSLSLRNCDERSTLGLGAFRVLFDMMDGIDDYFPLHECAPQIKVKGVGCDLVSLY